jgi:uncharacterized cupredoxin-like copper-binding protein
VLVGGCLLLLVLALAACSSTKTPVQVNVTASDFKFESSLTSFKKGVTYKFVVYNAGSINHDWFIMPRGAMDETKAIFGMDGDDLAAGATETREYQFTQTGEYEFACHVEGHYEAGMHLPIVVQ